MTQRPSHHGNLAVVQEAVARHYYYVVARPKTLLWLVVGCVARVAAEAPVAVAHRGDDADRWELAG